MVGAYQNELRRRASGEEVSIVDDLVVRQALVFIMEIAGSAKKKDIERIFPYPLSGREMSSVRTSLSRSHGSFSDRVFLMGVDGREGPETLIKIRKKVS